MCLTCRHSSSTILGFINSQSVRRAVVERFIPQISTKTPPSALCASASQAYGYLTVRHATLPHKKNELETLSFRFKD